MPGLQGDVRKMEDMRRNIDETVQAFGQLDVLVANAGIGHFGNIEEITEEQWHTTIDTNLT